MRHDEMVLTVSGSPVRAYRAGAGPELVLLHGGAPSDDARAWEPVWRALAGFARVTAPDLPGFGGTPLGPAVPTVCGYATWLGAFLDVCGIRTAGVAGTSLGGEIALRAALDLPSRITRLALCDSVRPAIAGPDGAVLLGRLACPVLLLSGATPGRDLVTFLGATAAEWSGGEVLEGRSRAGAAEEGGVFEGEADQFGAG